MNVDPNPADEVQTCAVCGSYYSPLGDSSGCISCAVRFAMSGEEEAPEEMGEEWLQQRLSTRKYGHFDIAVSDTGEPIELGHGAMGVTYRGWDTVLHTSVALKIINISVADHPEARTRFVREARAAAQLRHPNIASVFHYGEQDGDCFYAMELVEGETLEARVLREGPLSVYLALEIISQVAKALAAAEALGIVHRDLKPSNLMLVGKPGKQGEDETPVVKVIDFGLAKAASGLHEDRSATDTRILFVGTPAFASPEQYSKADDIRLDTRSDIYSLGVTFWYLLSGKIPFIGSSLEELEQKLRSRPLPIEQLVRARVPRQIIKLLRSLLAVDPALRPQSARELLELLQRYQEKFPLLTSERKKRLRRLVLVCGLSVAICAAGAFGFYQAQPPVIPPDRSIAVLPFQNLSPNKADAFFTSAIEYGMAATLAHLPSFKVIGPESTLAYKSDKLDYSTIGHKLGVRYLLSGSALCEGDTAHIMIQLVDTNNVTHPMTSYYDVPINDTSAFQSEKRRPPDSVHDSSSLLAFLLPIQKGGFGSLALGVGADVPFTEYEAEVGTLAGGASVVSLTSPPTPDCTSPPLEASGRAYVQLAGKDQSLTWTNNTDKSFTALNLRYSIPDAAEGGGITSTLDLYVNGTFRQALRLSSAQTWVYQSSVLQYGMSKVPAGGLSPHVFFDETHVWIKGEPIAPGNTITLKQDLGNSAAFYRIDLIDLEAPPPPVLQPADLLSIADFGARAGDDGFDNTEAFKNCIAAAEKQGKGVWIPIGTFFLTTPQGNIHATGIKIEGAGPWYSTISHSVPLPSVEASDILYCSSCKVRNLAFDSNANCGAISGRGAMAIRMVGTNWLADNLWAQHVGLIVATTQAGKVENCRVNNAWGMGISAATEAIESNPTDSNQNDQLIIENNFCRGNGSNGISLDSRASSPPFHRPRIVNNTSVCAFWGTNLRVSGGADFTVENNLLRDPVTDANMEIGVYGDEDANLDSALVKGNILVRGGAHKFTRFPTASLVIGGSNAKKGFRTTDVRNLDVVSNTISDSLFSGISYDSSFNTVLENNAISSPGGSGIVIIGDGPGVIEGNEISGISPDQSPTTLAQGNRDLHPPISATSFNSVSPGLSSTACSEGGKSLAQITNGSYAVYRTLNLTAVTTFVARVLPGASGGHIELRLEKPDGPLIGTADISHNDDREGWTTVTSSVAPTNGIHDVCLVFTGGGGDLFQIEWLSFYAEPTVVRASEFSTMSGLIKVENCLEKQTDIGTITNNSYTSYSNIDFQGKKTFYARVATAGTGGSIEVHLDNPAGLLIGTCVFPTTGGWQNWKTFSCGLQQQTGIHNLFLVYKGGDAGGGIFNVEWFGFDMPSVGFIEATRLNSSSPGLKWEDCIEGGRDLSSFSNGSYSSYNDINMTGLSSLTARMSSGASSGGEIQVHLDSPMGPLIGHVQAPATGGWQNWADQSCTLVPSEGFHNLYLVYSGDPDDMDSIKAFRLSP